MIQSAGNMMSLAQLTLTDRLQSEKVAFQMEAQAQKHGWEKWKLFQDLQTEIFKIQQEVCIQRAKTQDKLFEKWDEYIKN